MIRGEIKSKFQIWETLLSVIQIKRENIFCIGLTSYKTIFGELKSNYLRHPSYGGETEFEEMFKKVILKR